MIYTDSERILATWWEKESQKSLQLNKWTRTKERKWQGKKKKWVAGIGIQMNDKRVFRLCRVN